MAVIVNGTEIVLTGTVGGNSWWDEDFFTHADVITALAQVGRATDITVRVNSGGGIATEGAAIHAAFAQHKGKVGMVVEGWAASAASLLIMAGTTVTMSPGSLLMIHDPANGTWGTAGDHRKCADALDTMGDVFAQVYADKTGKAPKEMRAVMREEVWLGPAEAVEQGFADATGWGNDNQIEPVAFGGVGAYQRPPARIVALAKAGGWMTARQSMPGMSAAAPETAPQKESKMSDKPEKPEATASDKPADGTPAPAAPEAKADPAAIAEACAAAGMPATMAVDLMKRGSTMAQVNDRIATAKQISEVAALAGMPTMGPKLVAMGASLEQARDLIQETRVLNDAGTVTDTAHTNGDAPQNSGWGRAVSSLKPRK